MEFRDFPLRLALVTAVLTSALLAMILGIGTIGIPAYQKARTSFKELWKTLSVQDSLSTAQAIGSYFEKGPFTLKLTSRLRPKDLDRNGYFDLLLSALKQNAFFFSVYYVDQNGLFYGVFRETGRFYASFRKPLEKNGLSNVQTYALEKGNIWVLFKEENLPYNPKDRPYWNEGEKHLGGGWTDPYPFALTQKKGYSYVLPQLTVQGIKGFWVVDFELTELTRFLNTIELGRFGSLALFSEKDRIIAQSKNFSREDLSSSLKTLQGTTDFFETRDKIFYQNKSLKQIGIPWTLITIIHEKDYLEPIFQSTIETLYWGLIPCTIFLILAALFFGKISNRMKVIAHEIGKIGDFEIRSEKRPISRIREVNMMEKALENMKGALRSFSKYIHVDLVKKLIRLKGVPKLGGQKKRITILFADLAGFTSMTERLDPEETTAILGRFLDFATHEIHREKGMIDKFLGDAVMALWAAPEEIEDHALRACKTACKIRDFSEKEGKIELKIGINTGEATVGNFGSKERMDYTAIGDAVNVAARLEKLNKLYNTKILIGESCAQELKDHFLLRKLDWASIPGRQNPEIVYELIGEKEEHLELKAGIDLYETGLKAYREKNFIEAIEHFSRANEHLGGKDTPCSLLIERSKFFQKNGTPPNWNGAATKETI